MKVLHFLPALMLGMLVCACDEDETPKNSDGLLSSDEQTAKLITAGNDALNLIDAQDHQNLAETVGYFMANYQNYELDVNYLLRVLMGLVPEMPNISPIATVNSYMQLVNEMASQKIPSIDKKYYQQTLAFTDMSILYGEFTANDSLLIWQYNDSTITDRLQLSYKDNLDRDVVITLKGLGPTTTTRVDYSQFNTEKYTDYYENENLSNDSSGYFVTLTLPEKIVFSVSLDSEQIASLTFVTSLDCDIVAENYYNVDHNDKVGYSEETESIIANVDFENINMAVILDLNNYKTKIDWLLKQDTTSLNMGLIIKNQSIISLEAKLGGKFGEMLNDIDFDNISISDKLSSFDLNIDVMGQIQLKGSCSQPGILANMIIGTDENVELSLPMIVAGFNSLVDLDIYFDNGKDINSSVYVKYYPNTESKNEYITPVIEFKKDGSVLQFSEFFNEEKYSDLINNTANKASDFMFLFGSILSALM